MQAETQDTANFSINRFFNDLPIRIIGSPNEPFFYASDIATVLGITHLARFMRGFDQTEIVTPEKRIKYGIVTYRKYGNKWRRNNKVMLLTIFGAYRFIINSTSDIASNFKQYIYGVIEEIRQDDEIKINTIANNEATKFDEGKLLAYETYCKCVYVFTKLINDNPLKHILPQNRDDGIYYTDPNDDDGVEKELFKLTTKPCTEDYSEFTLTATLYGMTEKVLESIDYADGLPINEKSNQYCRYVIDFHMGGIEECVNIVYPGYVG